MRSENRRDGVAIVAVILVLVVALGAFVTSTAVLSIASRSTVAAERDSVQALLAADSALDTLPARLNVMGTQLPAATEAAIAAWIAPVADLDLGDGVSASVSIGNYDPVRGEALFIARGVTGSATRVVQERYEIVLESPPPFAAAILASITSFVPFKQQGGGNATVLGIGDTEEEWIFETAFATGTSPGPQDPETVPRTLAEARAGEYVEISSVRYRVEEDCSGGAANATLVDLTSGIQSSIACGASVGLIPFATTPDSDGDPTTLKVTDPTGSIFGVGDEIRVANGSGTVDDIIIEDDGSFTYVINWDTQPTVNPPAEGTVLRKRVVAAATQGAVSTPTPPSDCGVEDCITYPQGSLDNLWQTTFGVPFEGTGDPGNPVDGGVVRARSVERTSDEVMSGVSWLSATNNKDLNDLVGSGILIIDGRGSGDLKLNTNNNFTGLIYVIGDVSLSGNAISTGSIVVDGNVTLLNDDTPVTDGETKVTGTNDTRYDPISLERAISGIDSFTPPPGGLGDPIANSWTVR
ncbi:MAG: hypothetical protein ACIAS6_04145 [Phycisphaerales bacterium JB060]